jgi:hypothetical protein
VRAAVLFVAILAALGAAAPGAAAAPALEALGGAATRDVVVSLRADASVRDVLRAVPGVEESGRYPRSGAFAARAAAEEIRALDRLSGVVRVEPDRPATTFDVSAASGFGVEQLRLDMPGVDERRARLEALLDLLREARPDSFSVASAGMDIRAAIAELD